jgi:hypothetical protein
MPRYAAFPTANYCALLDTASPLPLALPLSAIFMSKCVFAPVFPGLAMFASVCTFCRTKFVPVHARAHQRVPAITDVPALQIAQKRLAVLCGLMQQLPGTVLAKLAKPYTAHTIYGCRRGQTSQVIDSECHSGNISICAKLHLSVSDCIIHPLPVEAESRCSVRREPYLAHLIISPIPLHPIAPHFTLILPSRSCCGDARVRHRCTPCAQQHGAPSTGMRRFSVGILPLD